MVAKSNSKADMPFQKSKYATVGSRFVSIDGRKFHFMYYKIMSTNAAGGFDVQMWFNVSDAEGVYKESKAIPVHVFDKSVEQQKIKKDVG